MMQDIENEWASCRDLGRMAYMSGDSFDDNPFSVGTFEHEMWAGGFESQRELCEYEECDFLDWTVPASMFPDDCYDSIDSEQ